MFQELWSAEKLKKIQKLQNWGLRIVYCVIYVRLDEPGLHNEAKLLLLEKRRVVHLLSIMYHRSKCPVFLDARPLVTRQFDKIKFRVITPNIKKAFRTTLEHNSGISCH